MGMGAGTRLLSMRRAYVSSTRDTVNPRTRKRLHSEYGPSPWWSREHLQALFKDEGLTAEQIADVWNVHAGTIDRRASEYGLRGASA